MGDRSLIRQARPARRRRSTWRVACALLVAAAPLAAHADWEQGMAAFDAGDFDAAAVQFTQVILADPEAHEAYYMMGRCYSELGRRDEAVANLEKAISIEQDDAAYALALGRELLSDGQYRRAHSVLGGISKDAFGGSEQIVFGLLRVRAAIKSGHPEEAVEQAVELVQYDPDRAAFHRALGAALDAAGRREEAIAELARAFELDPRDTGSAKAAVQRAASLARRSESEAERLGHYRVAAEIAEKLGEAVPDSANLILAGEMWLGAKDPDRALALFERAHAALPDDPLGLYYLGSCLAAADREDEAVERLTAALELEPGQETQTRVHALLGSLYAGRMELELAAEHWRAAGKETKAAEIERLSGDVAELVRRRAEIDEQVASLERIITSFEELGEEQGIGVVRQRIAALRQEQAEIERELDRVRRALD